MFKNFKFIAFISILLLTGCESYKGPARLPLGFNGYRADRSVSSYYDIQYRYVEKQKYDYSCGTGALATLVNYYFGKNITEKEIIKLIFKGKSKKEQRTVIEKGFSLLDLKEAAVGFGYIAEGYRLRPEQLRQLSGPVIVFIHPDGYKHFAICKGVRGSSIYLADPSLGNVRRPFELFNTYWDGITLALGSKKDGSSTLDCLKLPEEQELQPEILSATEIARIRTSSIPVEH